MRYAMLLAAGLAMAASAGHAQIGNLPPDVAEAIRAQGAILSPGVVRATADVFKPLHAPAKPPGVREQLDLPYGGDAKQRLDVYAPDTPGRPRAVLVFVHGGGFIAGDKRPTGAFFYQNLGYMAVRHDLVSVVMTYRLAPYYRFPTGADDVAAVLQWVRANIASQGGDPSRIVLMGHSAGAAHVADYVARQLRGRTDPGVSGLILASGIYAPAAMAASPSIAAYYGTDQAIMQEQAALPALAASGLPIMVTLAEFDPPSFADQGRALREALCRTGPDRCAPLLVFKGHNHLSEVFALNTADRAFEDRIANFMTQFRN